MNRAAVLSSRYDVEILRNPRFSADPDPSIGIFSEGEADAAFARISSWPGYRETPLSRLASAASDLGVGALWCKREEHRLGLASFKALGAMYAVVTFLSELLAERLHCEISDLDLLDGQYRVALRDVVLACATDGNHGFSVARAAAQAGCRARIFIPRGVSAGREAALRSEGAEIVRVDGIYEDAVDAANAVAEAEPETWIISDYGTPQYTEIPLRCMLGYSVMTQEIGRQLGAEVPTHVFAPAGCGGLAAAMICSMRQRWRDRPPRIVVVEPVEADCVFASARNGGPVRLEGDLETLMGGLACAAVSHVAWPVLDAGAFAFLRMNDAAAVAGMRYLARPQGGDEAIVAGETGAAGLGALLAVHDDAGARRALELDRSSRVLVIACEGATDPVLYEELVGDAAGLLARDAAARDAGP